MEDQPARWSRELFMSGMLEIGRMARGAFLVGMSMLQSGVGVGAANAQTSPPPFTTVTQYDLGNRVTGTIAPDPGSDLPGTLRYAAVRNSYDIAGRLVTVEQGALSTWQPDTAPSAWTGFSVSRTEVFTYNQFDQKQTDKLVGSNGIAYALVQYSYDTFHRLECTAVRMNPAAYGSLPTSACTLGTEGTQGADRITKNSYDPVGNLLTVQKSYGTPLRQDYATYTYSPNYKQASVKDANGNVAGYSYDAYDRQEKWEFPDLATGAPSTTDFEQYFYDANGNRTSLRKRDGRTINYSYDALNRPTAKTFGGGACVTSYACTTPPSGAVRDVYYSYDLRGLQTYARFDSATGADNITNVYDGFGRLSSSTTNMAGTSRKVAYAYDADGNRTQMKHPDATRFVFAFDGLDRMATANIYGGAQFLAILYDAQGRRTSTTQGASQTSYLYDPVSRLDTETQTFASGTKNTASTFGYNPAGQITNQSRSNDAYAFTGYTPTNNTYAVNALNQYVTVGAGPLGYDSNGNLAATSGTSFTYDVENRLVAAVGTLNASLVYDPNGRLFQTSTPNVASSITQFLYDGDALIAEYDGSGNVLRRYVHGPGVDAPVMWAEGSDLSTLRFYHPDHQGSIVATANASGAPFETYTYDEYGVAGGANFANKGRFQYTGQTWIPELGMYYYKARIYSAKIGRFLQTDPIGYKDQMDLYAYVGNDPIDGRDPSGKRFDFHGDSELKKLVYDVGKTNTEFGRKLSVMEQSRHVIKVAWTGGIMTKPDARTTGENGARNSQNGVGTDSQVIISRDTIKGVGMGIGGKTIDITPGDQVAHEAFGHAYEYTTGTYVDSKVPGAPEGLNDPAGNPLQEGRAIGVENEYRSAHNEDPRLRWGSPDTTDFSGYGPMK